MLCLGIETSCDETSLALVKDGKLIDQVLASQTDLHALFGGVVPELASREHYRHIGPLFDLLFKKSGLKYEDLDLVAVTRGPGLLGSLLVGVAFAKALAIALKIPIIGINHLHAHLLACGLNNQLHYPAIGLLVSGGHTQLYLIEAPDKFIQLGRTIDDAAGEAFDKIGNLLKLPYPAGKSVDQLAQNAQSASYTLPTPFVDNSSLDFSFSGLKTAAALLIKKEPWLSDTTYNPERANFCASLNQAISSVLLNKLRKALRNFPQCESIWLAGGVAANSEIRKKISQLATEQNKSFLCPTSLYCTDNAAMIAYAGELLGQLGYQHSTNFETIPRGKKIPADMQCKPLST